MRGSPGQAFQEVAGRIENGDFDSGLAKQAKRRILEVACQPQLQEERRGEKLKSLPLRQKPKSPRLLASLRKILPITPLCMSEALGQCRPRELRARPERVASLR